MTDDKSMLRDALMLISDGEGIERLVDAWERAVGFSCPSAFVDIEIGPFPNPSPSPFNGMVYNIKLLKRIEDEHKDAILKYRGKVWHYTSKTTDDSAKVKVYWQKVKG